MKYEIIDKKQIIDYKLVKVVEVKLDIDTYSQGKISIKRFALVRPEVAAVLIYLVESDEVVLVEQFRYSSLKTESGWVKEVVAGLIEPGEDVELCAKRETLEEAGYRVSDLELIQSFYPGWGFSDQIVHLYFAQVRVSDQTTSGGGLIDETEDVKVCRQPLSELKQEIADGKIKDAKTLIALQWLMLKKLTTKDH